MLRYLTAGESHGPQLTVIVEGLPAGVSVAESAINADLARRQGGYGRGGRMKIERDEVEIVSGVRWGETLGSPVTLVIRNRDWQNWSDRMSPDPAYRDESIRVTRPRPGHADLAGVQKYGHRDVRNVLERSSARETAARVAAGSLAKSVLAHFGIDIVGYVRELGGITTSPLLLSVEEIKRISAVSPFYACDPSSEENMRKLVDSARESGDSLGGVVEVLACGIPVGLGSHVQWDRRLDARLAMAVMSIQAFKGVEIGLGFQAARLPGSKVHDEIYYDKESSSGSPFRRRTNNAGGIEGGISNGELIVVRGAMKPIPTLYRPLRSVDIDTKEAFEATVERSDVCAVPAAAVVAEAAVALELAGALLEKFGGDSVGETGRNLDSFNKSLFEL